MSLYNTKLKQTQYLIPPLGSMNWTAPEVLEKAYDQRSDVWSLGCVMLELASTAFCDKTTMAGKLFEIKHNPTALQQLLEQVEQVSNELF